MNLLSRGRARMRVCLLVLTVCLAGAAYSAPTASATNFAVLFGGTQGGSDQDATLIWSHVRAIHAQNLSFIFGAGYWPHMHKIQRECSMQQALTSSCPQASRIATVAATFSEPGSILPVVRTGYLALERKRSGELSGYDVLLVLDQNSRYRSFTGRRRVEVLKSNKQGDPDANKRLDLGAPPQLVTRSGAASQARMIGLSITTQKRWMRLPTSCDGGSTVSAATTFVDGSVETVPRTPSVTGCGSLTVDSPLSVMFNPREYTLTKSVPWNVAGRVGDHADGELTTDPRTVTMKMMGAPKIGEATAVFNVACTPAQADVGACPSESRLGEFCVESSPAGEVACGDVWNSGVHQPGSGGGGAGGSVGLLFSLTKFSDGSGGGGGGAGGLIWVGDGSVRIVPGTGESILTINNLPQADLHGFRMSGDNPLFESNNQCGTNPLYGRVAGWNGAVREATGVTAIACSPGIETTDFRDGDKDQDGLADDPLRAADFSVPFKLTDRGTGIDPSSVSCRHKGWDGTVKGSTKVADLDRDGMPDVCIVSGSDSGESVLEISAAGLDGHVTVLKLGFTIDADPPVVTIEKRQYNLFDTFPVSRFTVDDANPASSTCELFDAASGALVHVDDDCDDFTDANGEVCDAGNDADGDCKRTYVIPHVLEKSGTYRVVITHTDSVGNSGTASDEFTLDVDPPVATLTNYLDRDDDGDGWADGRWRPAFFDVFFTATDEHSGVDWITNTCTVRMLGGALPGGAILSARVVDVDGDGTPDACRIENAPDGDIEVEISVADYRGHVTVLKMTATVDTTPPAISIDEPGVHFALESFFDVFTELGFTIDGIRGHRDVGGYRCATYLNGDYDGISRPTSNCAPAGELGGPPALQLQPGSNHVTLVVMDPAGNIATAFFDIFYDVGPPIISPDPGGSADQVKPTQSFGVGFTAVHGTFSLSSSEPATICWMLAAGDASIRFDGKVVMFGGLDDTIEFRCEFENVPDGAYELYVSVTDAAGLEGVYSRPLTVDIIAPEVSFFPPGSQPFDGMRPFFFSVDDANPGSSVCSVLNLDTGAVVVGDEDCDGFVDSAGRPCEPDDSIGSDLCRRVFVLPHVLEVNGSYRATVVHTDLAGHVGSSSVEFTVDSQGPVITLTDSRDPGCDDRTQPTCYRQAFFDIFFTATDDGVGVDWTSAMCRAKGIVTTKPGSGGSTAGRMIDDDGDQVPDRCSFEGLDEGEYEVELGVADYRGHVTVLKLHYTVDSTPPAISIDEPGVHFTSNGFFDLWTDLDTAIDGRTDPADLDGYSCTILHEADLDGDGELDQLSRATGGCGGGGGGSGGSLRVLPTVNKITLEVSDPAGNTSSRVIDVYFDTEAPSIAIDEPGAHITGDPDFDLLFTADDNSLDVGGPLSATCGRKGYDGWIHGSAKLTKADAGRALAGECSFTGVADGTYEVELTVFDASGHVTVLKHSVTVDTTPPVISGLSPADGEWIACPATDDPTVTGVVPIKFTLSDSSEDLASVEVSFNRGPRQTVSLDGSYQRTFDMAVDCREMTTGMDVEYRVFATDRAGNKDDTPATVLVDKSPPVLTTTDPRDDDSDGDGFADQRFRAPAFELFFDGYEQGSGIADTSCGLEDAAGRATKGKVKVIRDSGSGFACQVEEADEGDVFVVATVSDVSGHVTVLKRGFTVDAQGPVIRLANPGDADSDGDGVADDPVRSSSFEVAFEAFDDVSGVDEGSPSCSAEWIVSIGLPKITPKIAKEHHGKFRCIVEGAPSGEIAVTGTVRDRAGNVVLNRISFTVDATGPAIRLTDPRDADSDGDVFADEPIRDSRIVTPFTTVNDPEFRAAQTAKCLVRGWNPEKKEPIIGVADLDGDGVPDACVVENAPEGEIEIAFMIGGGNQIDVIIRKFVIQPPAA